MSAFCSADDVAAFLQIELDDYGASLQRAIEEASAAIQNYCHQKLERVEDDMIEFVFSRGRRLFLPELPVIVVSEVVEDDVLLTETDDYVLAPHGVLHRVGRDWVGDAAFIRVTYTHGYEMLPDDVVAVATRATARAYQAGLRAANAGGVPGIASTSLGDYAVTFTGEGGGDGVMGASAAPMLLRSEKEILDRYRVTA